MHFGISTSVASWQSIGGGLWSNPPSPPPPPPKDFGLFKAEGQMNSLQYKKVCKLIYFECKFNANLL